MSDKNPPLDDTAPCLECSNPIPDDATRCPECGYDPAPGHLALLGLFVFAPLAGIGGLLGVATVAGLLVGAFGLEEAIGALLATVIVFGVPVWYVWYYWRRANETAAE